jgi:glycosyltransferase involved in cell wall biosynthesis
MGLMQCEPLAIRNGHATIVICGFWRLHKSGARWLGEGALRMATPSNVSVVIATFNRASFLPETLRSIIRQTRPAYEIIVVDDGSTDQTAEVVATLGFPVRYERIENRGPQAARAHGVRMAQGNLIAVVDDDDLWMPEKLAIQVQTLEESGCSWVYGDAIAFDHESGKELYRFSEVCRPRAGQVLNTLLMANFIPSPTVVIDRALLMSIQERPGKPDVRFGEDWMTWLLAAAEAPLARVDAVVARYRIHAGGTASQTQVERRLRDCEHVLDYCQSSMAASIHPAIRRARGMARLKGVVGLWAESRYGPACSLALRTLLRRPLMLLEVLAMALTMGLRMVFSKLRTLRRSRP